MPKIGDYRIIRGADGNGQCITMSGPDRLDRRCRKDPSDPPYIEIENETTCRVRVRLTGKFRPPTVDVDPGQTVPVILDINVGGGSPSTQPRPIPPNDCEPNNPRQEWNAKIEPVNATGDGCRICRPLRPFGYPPEVVVEC